VRDIVDLGKELERRRDIRESGIHVSATESVVFVGVHVIAGPVLEVRQGCGPTRLWVGMRLGLGELIMLTYPLLCHWHASAHW